MTAPDQQQVIADALAALIERLLRDAYGYVPAGVFESAMGEIRALGASNAGTDPADGQAVAVGLSEDERALLHARLTEWFGDDRQAFLVSQITPAVEAILAARRGHDTERALDEVEREFIRCPHEVIRATCVGVCNCPCDACAPTRAAGGTP